MKGITAEAIQRKFSVLDLVCADLMGQYFGGVGELPS